MSFSKILRDADIRMMERHGHISSTEAKVRTRKRDMKEMKMRSLCFAILLMGVAAEGMYFGVHVYLVAGIAFYLLLRDVYSTWMKLTEMDTEIKYLEAGLVLTRRKRWG